MKEQDIQRQIMNWLELQGVVAWKCDLGGVRRGGGIRAKNPLKGFPDLAIICPPGRFAVVEVKTDAGRLSPDQIKWRDRLVGQGVIYILARSLEDVTSALSNHLPMGA